MGLKIFVHALRMVFQNFRQVLRITLGPAAIGVLIMALLLFSVGMNASQFDGQQTNEMPEEFFLGFSVSFVVFTCLFLWIAVAWHRFILLEEYPKGLLPPFRSSQILAYLWRFLILGGIGIVLMLPAMMIFLGFAQASGGGAVVIFILICVMIAISVLFTRLSIILPAAAIGRPITIGQAWENTKGQSGAICVVILLSLVFQFVVQFAAALLAIIPILGILVAFFVGMLIIPVLNLSLLTTMYGVFVEKRELT